MTSIYLQMPTNSAESPAFREAQIRHLEKLKLLVSEHNFYRMVFLLVPP